MSLYVLEVCESESKLKLAKKTSLTDSVHKYAPYTEMEFCVRKRLLALNYVCHTLCALGTLITSAVQQFRVIVHIL
jgi:hypothetical protein